MSVILHSPDYPNQQTPSPGKNLHCPVICAAAPAAASVFLQISNPRSLSVQSAKKPSTSDRLSLPNRKLTRQKTKPRVAEAVRLYTALRWNRRESSQHRPVPKTRIPGKQTFLSGRCRKPMSTGPLRLLLPDASVHLPHSLRILSRIGGNQKQHTVNGKNLWNLPLIRTDHFRGPPARRCTSTNSE